MIIFPASDSFFFIVLHLKALRSTRSICALCAYLEFLHGLAQLLGRLVCEVSLQVVLLGLVDPLLHLLHLLPQSHRLIEAAFQGRLLCIGLEGNRAGVFR